MAQAEARQAAAVAQLNAARAQLQSSIAVYRQIIGKEPSKLRGPAGVGKLVPGQLQRALDIAFAEHPAILATKYLVDQADWNEEFRKRSSSSGNRWICLEALQLTAHGQVTDSAQVTATPGGC
ncbi:MAG: hypothetical protein R3D34_09065 [Nitratireductor sp.]